MKSSGALKYVQKLDTNCAAKDKKTAVAIKKYLFSWTMLRREITFH